MPAKPIGWPSGSHSLRLGSHSDMCSAGTFLCCRPSLPLRTSYHQQVAEPSAAVGFAVGSLRVQRPYCANFRADAIRLVLAVLNFLAFLMSARGRAVPENILLITVPLVAVTDIELAYGLVYTLIAGSILAVSLQHHALCIFPRAQPRK